MMRSYFVARRRSLSAASLKAADNRGRKAPTAVAILVGFLAAGGALLRLARDPLAPVRTVQLAMLRREGAQYLGRYGVVLQRTLFDCGPAALANLLRVEGRAVPSLDSLSALARMTARGTTLGGLQSAAVALGVRAEARRLDPAAALTAVELPMLLWIRRDHFVLVTERAPDGMVTIVDPEVGRYRLSMRAFRRVWSGEALVLSPVAAVRG
jgi:predicted double-glycine peptidase